MVGATPRRALVAAGQRPACREACGGRLRVRSGCHRSRYSETCAASAGLKTQVSEYRDLWHRTIRAPTILALPSTAGR